MATRYGITLPNGAHFTLLYDKGQDKSALLEKLILEPWRGYCLKNWLSDDYSQPYAPEHKVKRLLDRCGSLLLRDVPPDSRDTLTTYKEMMIGSREINVSDCPEGIVDMLESGVIHLSEAPDEDRTRYQVLKDKLDAKSGFAKEQARRKEHKRQSTRFDRLQAIRQEHPGGEFTHCRVDTNGMFDAAGQRFSIDPACKKYAPRHTRYGDQYDMDRVLVLLCADGEMVFADQDGYLIDETLIQHIKE